MADPHPTERDTPGTPEDPSRSGAEPMDLLAVKARDTAPGSDLRPERDITDEPPRIGVFLCGCEGEISSLIDVEGLAAHARSLPFVALADGHARLCDTEGRALIAKRVDEYRLNRIVVASCTPRTHEAHFRDVVREAGLNRHLLALVNLRSGCAWVHASAPVQANAKACDLVTMAAFRAARTEPLPDRRVPTSRAALVVGGRVGGVTAALALAERGLAVHLVERAEGLADCLGPIAPRGGAQGGSTTELARLARSATENRRIALHLASEVVRIDGQAGHFVSHVLSGSKVTVIEHGVIVVDLAAREHAAIPLHGEGSCPEAHTRLAPTELANEGLFACGAVSGLPLPEAMDRARAMTAQAALILDRKEECLDVLAAHVDSVRCAQCLTCLRTCPEHAPRVGQNGKSEIQEALCVACGTCAASCPAGAVSIPGHTDAQIQAALCGLLNAELEPFISHDDRTQSPGISWPRWHAREATSVPDDPFAPERRRQK